MEPESAMLLKNFLSLFNFFESYFRAEKLFCFLQFRRNWFRDFDGPEPQRGCVRVCVREREWERVAKMELCVTEGGKESESRSRLVFMNTKSVC